MELTVTHLEALLAEADLAIQDPMQPLSPVLDEVFDQLRGVRAQAGAAWRNVVPRIVAHPVRLQLHADPFTYRSFSKPRGYPGDAVLLDYIYSRASPTPLERGTQRLFEYTVARPGPEAVRERCRGIAAWVDGRGASSRGRPLRILSLASGHLREAGLSRAAARGDVEVWTAIDHDPASLAVASTEAADSVVRPVRASVRDVVTGRISERLAASKAPVRGYDLVYAAGLYDYLTDAVAKRVTKWLAACLCEGGELLLANFLPEIPDVGYMETFMDWTLVYRTADAVVGLIPADGEVHLAVQRSWLDTGQNIASVVARRE